LSTMRLADLSASKPTCWPVPRPIEDIDARRHHTCQPMCVSPITTRDRETQSHGHAGPIHNGPCWQAMASPSETNNHSRGGRLDVDRTLELQTACWSWGWDHLAAMSNSRGPLQVKPAVVVSARWIRRARPTDGRQHVPLPKS
jgi:hypothetical protein